MKEITIPKHFLKKNTESYYISEFVTFYIEKKKETTGKSKGKIIEEAVMKSSDFKEVINSFFEANKI